MAYEINSVEALRQLLGEPVHELVLVKSTPVLTQALRRFIERSPFACLATYGADGSCDLSPRGPGHIADRFSFNGTAGDTVSIGADWTGLDGILYLQSPSGEIAAENDDFEGEGQSRIEHRLAESGNYRVWSVARDKEQIGTYNLDLTCNSPKGPDLHIDAPNLERNQVRPGQKLPLTVSVVNLGKEAAAPARVRYFLSDSASVSYATDRLLGSSDLQSLQPDESAELSRTLTMDVKPGLYWLGACVSGDVLESNIENNCAYHGPLRVEDKGEPVPITPLFNDAWYNPATVGQGFFINVFPDNQQVFLSWFTYDLDRPDESVTAQLGDPGHRWLTGFGTYQRGQANLDVMLNEGGVFDAALPAPQESIYGSMTITFSDCNNGQIEYDIPTAGEPEVIPITRITSDNLAACEERRVMGDAHAARTPQQTAGHEAGFNINAGINDAWYNPETTGQGLFFNVFPNREKVFLSWFTYETERPAIDVPFQLGEPGHRWLTALGDYFEDSAELMLYKVNGGVFNSADPVPGETEYGSLLVHVNDCASAELIYDLPSLSREGLIPLQRLAPDSIPLCEASQARVDAGRLNIVPSDKQVLENFCGGSANWSFNWPDSPRASGYELELWRNDMLIPMTFRVSESEFLYEKGTAIQAPHLEGWQWRYRPVYPTAVQSAEFSPAYSFNVGDCEA